MHIRILCSCALILLPGVEIFAQAERKKARDRLPGKVASLDKNEDGVLSAAESPPGARKKILQEFDLNNDNALDALELRAYLLSKKGEKPAAKNVETGD